VGSMKKMLGVAAVGVIAVMSLASAASAQTAGTAPPSPGPCVFTISPTGSTTFPVNVTVSGTAPVGVKAMVFVGGVQKGSVTVLAGGTFTFTNITVPDANTGVTVNYTYGNGNAYTTICAAPGGEVVLRVRAESVTLAFTGSSSNTGTYVLVGVAAIVLGLVMVVGVKRRASVRG
jgi:hypothetical protein